MSQTNVLPERAEIEPQYKWKLEDLFETDEAWEEACGKLSGMIQELKNYQESATKSGAEMTQYLKKCDETEQLFERIVVYSNQKMHEDMREAKYQGYAAKADSLETALMEAEAFFEPAVLALSETTLEQYFLECADLDHYRLLIERIVRKKAHTLSAEMEALLAASYEIASAPQDIFMLFQNADLKFGTVKDEEGNDTELTHGRYLQFMESADREVRKNAFQTLYAKYKEYRNTLAATYTAGLKKAKFYAKARKYNSSLEHALDNSNIPTAVYDSLIESVHAYLPSMYRYVALRKKVLQVEELHMYDVYAKLTKDVKMHVEYGEAKKLVLEGLSVMGEEYTGLLQEGFANGWVDVYENQGKRSGAYSWGAYGTHPYVLLNYGNQLEDVFTLAHEMGHALHTYYSNANQPYTYSGYRIFVAEVASTCNEFLLMQHLLKKCTDKQEKIFLLNYFIDQFKGTIFRQTMFAEFEKITHAMCDNDESLTADDLCEIYTDLNKKYFGPDMVIDEEIAMEWARIPHFYNEFYVYQYATGFSAAIALAKGILEKGEPAVEAYKTFLKGGSSKDPIDLLKGAGVDLSSPKPVEDALKMFDELVKELEALL